MRHNKASIQKLVQAANNLAKVDYDCSLLVKRWVDDGNTAIVALLDNEGGEMTVAAVSPAKLHQDLLRVDILAVDEQTVTMGVTVSADRKALFALLYV